ncbi:MAG: DUF1801 domain-containing protein [Armatimonadota bacterium]
MHPEPPDYLEFLKPYPSKTVELARGLRQSILSILPPCVEIIWDATNTVGPSYGFSDKNRDHFIHLPTYTSYVNIGFTNGVSLDDPEGRLVGSGAKIRHIKLNRIEDLDDPYIRNLIDQAVLTAARPNVATEPCVIIRQMEGPKRRPKPAA